MDPCLGEGSCGLQVGQKDWTRSTRQYCKALLRGKETHGTASVEEEPQAPPQLLTSGLRARRPESGPGLRSRGDAGRGGEGGWSGRAAGGLPVLRVAVGTRTFHRATTGCTSDLPNKMASPFTGRTAVV